MGLKHKAGETEQHASKRDEVSRVRGLHLLLHQELLCQELLLQLLLLERLQLLELDLREHTRRSTALHRLFKVKIRRSSCTASCSSLCRGVCTLSLLSNKKAATTKDGALCPTCQLFSASKEKCWQ